MISVQENHNECNDQDGLRSMESVSYLVTLISYLTTNVTTHASGQRSYFEVCIITQTGGMPLYSRQGLSETRSEPTGILFIATVVT